MFNLSLISESLIKGDAVKVKQYVEQAINEGVELQKILNEGLIAGMNVVGEKFKKNEIYIPEVLRVARAMHAGLSVLKPLLSKSSVSPIGRFVIGTVKDDLHDIGKNLVAMMVEGAGFEVIDLGIDVPPEKFIDAAEKYRPDVIGLSALLTTTMFSMKRTVEILKNAGITAKIIVGGAPVTQKFADEIGADGYAPDAVSAVDKIKELIGIK
jgi:5-methyltetrahydrofolate--homocysteine methyltransferase